jgi:hypothetical protein
VGFLAAESRGATTEIRYESGTEAGDGGGRMRRHGRDGEGKVPAVWHGMRMQGMVSVAAARSVVGVVGGGCWGRRSEANRRDEEAEHDVESSCASWLQEEKALTTLIEKQKMDMGITEDRFAAIKKTFFYHVSGIPLCRCIMCQHTTFISF